LEVVEEELVDPFLVDAKSPPLFLEIDILGLPIFGCLLDEIVDHFRMEAVENFVEEVPLRQPHLILASWIRQVVGNIRESQSLLVDLLNRQLWPVGNSLCWHISLEKSLLPAAQDGLDVGQTSLLQGWHQVAHWRKYME
jgi:hypothetical protein